MSIKSLVATIFLSICFSFYSFSQIVEKASLMKIRDPYNEAQRHHIYNALPNGNKLLSGTVGYSMQYNNWILTNSDSLSPSLRYYVALFNESDSLLWVKYLNGYVRAADSDAKNNVYLTGTYKSRLHTSDGDILDITVQMHLGMYL
jgi:hypothetical protein